MPSHLLYLRSDDFFNQSNIEETKISTCEEIMKKLKFSTWHLHQGNKQLVTTIVNCKE